MKDALRFRDRTPDENGRLPCRRCKQLLPKESFTFDKKRNRHAASCRACIRVAIENNKKKMDTWRPPIVLNIDAIAKVTQRLRNSGVTTLVKDAGSRPKKTGVEYINPTPETAATGRRSVIKGQTKLWCFKCKREKDVALFRVIKSTQNYANYCNDCRKKDPVILLKEHRREARGLIDYPLEKRLPHVRAKVTEEQVRWIRKHAKHKTKTQAEMSRELDLNAGVVYAIVNYDTYKWVKDLEEAEPTLGLPEKTS